jgi:hypothetical protein
MKRKRPTRDTAMAKYRQALDRRNRAFADLARNVSLFFAALNQKEPTRSEPRNQQAKSL